MEIIDRPLLAHQLAFKGSTCAAMRGCLERYSPDLDFDLQKTADEGELRKELHGVFNRLGLKVVAEFDRVLFFNLRYPSPAGGRNFIKINVIGICADAGQYQVQYFPEIDRLMNSQTPEAMFTHLLATFMERFTLNPRFAGRDIYDIHSFLAHGYSYDARLIQAKSGFEAEKFVGRFADFVQKHVTQATIDDDLSTLLPVGRYQAIREILLPETLALLMRVQERIP